MARNSRSGCVSEKNLDEGEEENYENDQIQAENRQISIKEEPILTIQ
jgi:hypothetical protein